MPRSDHDDLKSSANPFAAATRPVTFDEAQLVCLRKIATRFINMRRGEGRPTDILESIVQKLDEAKL